MPVFSHPRARARRSRAARRIRAALWAAAPPIYFWRMRFAVIDGDGGCGALSYGVSFAKRAIATARHGLRTCSRSAFSPLRRGRSRPLATALNLHVKRGRVACFLSPARAREAKPSGAANPRRAVGRGAADLFLANAFCCDRRRRWLRRSELRGQLRQAGDRNSTTWPSDVLALRFFAPATGPIATARDRIEFACEKGARCLFSLTRARARGEAERRGESAPRCGPRRRRFIFGECVLL